MYGKTSYDEYGKEVLGSGVTYKARVQIVNKSRFLPNGQNVVIDAIAYINGAPTININDKLAYSGVNYKVHSKTVPVDGQGNQHHTKLELIKWNN